MPPRLGTLLTLPGAALAEILADAGVEWFFVDLEHGMLAERDVLDILRATAHRVPAYVRVPHADAPWIGRVLDLGAAGVIAPRIRSADDARRVVRLAKYPPLGERGVGASRAQGYGYAIGDAVATANARTEVILQVEERSAVEEIDGILAVPGVDALFIGPFDLSGSYGLPGQLDAPVVQDAIARVRGAAAARGVPVGIFAPTAERARAAFDAGFSYVAVASDALLLGRAARDVVAVLGAGRR